MSSKAADHTLVCTFCKKDQHTVKKLIAGPGVYICDGCVALCTRILEGKEPGVPSLGGTR